jgi:hypothetical protein
MIFFLKKQNNVVPLSLLKAGQFKISQVLDRPTRLGFKTMPKAGIVIFKEEWSLFFHNLRAVAQGILQSTCMLEIWEWRCHNNGVAGKIGNAPLNH